MSEVGVGVQRGRLARRGWMGWLGLAVVLVMGVDARMAAAPVRDRAVAREYDIKATFLFNFSLFVEWPPATLSNSEAPFIIGILGSDPFEGFLDQLVKNERAHGRRIEIQRPRRVEEAIGAHILFISHSEEARLETILRSLAGRPVLTVGDMRGASVAQHGGIVDLVTDQGKVRVRINLASARAAGLTISSKLLRIAEIVETEAP